MQDYNYVWAQCLELTLELSCCKFPQPKELPALWMDNKKALLAYIQQVHLGENLPTCPPFGLWFIYFLFQPEANIMFQPETGLGLMNLCVFRGERPSVRWFGNASGERSGGG